MRFNGNLHFKFIFSTIICSVLPKSTVNISLIHVPGPHPVRIFVRDVTISHGLFTVILCELFVQRICTQLMYKKPCILIFFPVII